MNTSGIVVSAPGAVAADVRLGTTNGGTGTLAIENGGTLSNATSLLGYATGSTGSATVSDTGSIWTTNSTLHVGNNGGGTLTIEDGGRAASASGYIGRNTGSTGTVIVTGSGSELYATNELRIGNSGTGTLRIENGGIVDNNSSAIAFSINTTGSVVVTGNGSQWVNRADLRIGSRGSALLTIEDGGSVSNTWGSIARFAGSSGSVLVTGAGSQWSNSNDLRVGQEGTGTLIVSAGGTLSNANGWLGDASGSTGTATVSGLGASWTNSGDLFVGNSGNGTLTIEDRGVLTSTAGWIGRQSGASGMATIADPGSQWTNSADLYIGDYAAGTLTLTDGGMVLVDSGVSYTYTFADNTTETRTSTGTIFLAHQSGSSGTLNIGAASGDTAAAAGHVDAAQLVFGDGTGLLVFNHTDTDYEFAAALVGAGTIEFLSGTTILTGDISGFTGQFTGTAGLRFTPGATTELASDQSAFSGTTTVADASTLAVTGSLGGTTIVQDGGILKGNGSLGNLAVNNGGTAAPGSSIGTTNVANVSFAPGSAYQVELNGAGQSDLILATGTATLTGGTVEAIAFPDYALGSAYTILTAAGGVTGTFDDSSFAVPFLSAMVSYDTNNVYLTLAPNSTAVDSAVQTSNQRAVAAVAAAQVGSLSFATPLYMSADAATFQAGLDSLSGEIHASMAGALIGEQRRLRSFALTDSRLHDASLTLGDTTFWAQGFGSFGNTSGTANTARMTQDNAGTLIGAERSADGRRAGIAIGASRSHMEQDGRSSKAASDNVHLVAYTGNRGGGGRTQHTVGASVSLHSIDTARTVTANNFNDTSNADYRGRSAEAFAEIAHPLAAGGKATLTPYVQGAVTVHRQDGFTESGEAGLIAGTSTTKVASTILGARYERPFEIGTGRTLHASAGAAWQHLYGDDTPDTTLGFTQAPASRFSVEGAPLARDAALLSAALTTNATDDLALSLGYDASLAKETTTHAFTARGEYSF